MNFDVTQEQFESSLKDTMDIWKNSNVINELEKQLMIITESYLHLELKHSIDYNVKNSSMIFHVKFASRFEYVARQLNIKIINLQVQESRASRENICV